MFSLTWMILRKIKSYASCCIIRRLSIRFTNGNLILHYSNVWIYQMAGKKKCSPNTFSAIRFNIGSLIFHYRRYHYYQIHKNRFKARVLRSARFYFIYSFDKQERFQTIELTNSKFFNYRNRAFCQLASFDVSTNNFDVSPKFHCDRPPPPPSPPRVYTRFVGRCLQQVARPPADFDFPRARKLREPRRRPSRAIFLPGKIAPHNRALQRALRLISEADWRVAGENQSHGGSCPIWRMEDQETRRTLFWRGGRGLAHLCNSSPEKRDEEREKDQK